PIASDNESFLPAPGQRKRIEVEIEWAGEVDYQLRTAAPRSGFVADRDSWVKLWKAYRGAEPVPEVDFDRQLILVGLVNEPNWVKEIIAVLDDRGNLKVGYMSTLLAIRRSPNWCSYVFAPIHRRGIRSVDGHPVPRP